jgi:hypothetical protein
VRAAACAVVTGAIMFVGLNDLCFRSTLGAPEAINTAWYSGIIGVLVTLPLLAAITVLREPREEQANPPKLRTRRRESKSALTRPPRTLPQAMASLRGPGPVPHPAAQQCHATKEEPHDLVSKTTGRTRFGVAARTSLSEARCA